ncbi:MAG: hypothetical protein KF729_22140 [Sandaracinaceae bacterium]|nr:hypothetical protein [Sandaracinaceae bacterium]
MSRVLLAEGTSRADIDRAARARGWPLLNLLRRTEGRPRQIVFGAAEWLLTFVEDHRIAATYAIVHAHDEESVARAVREALPTLGLDDVLARVATDRVRAICWLGVVGPGAPASPVRELLAAAAASADPRERDAADFAYEALGWPR